MNNIILGIWDGHDSGAAIIQNGNILAVVNEERLSRNKLEIGFPNLSIASCLETAGISAQDISTVAISTTDFAKTLTRCFPTLRKEYYLLRRKKKLPGLFNRQKKMLKYEITRIPSNFITKSISNSILKKQLKKIGINAQIKWIEHHQAHAAATAMCSNFDSSTVITIDGIGDALSGSVNIWKNGNLNRISSISGKDSFGIFFEHITNLLNMRELEDEGKVMALANYAFPIPDYENPLLKMFSVDEISVKCAYGSAKLYRELGKVLYRYPSEQFAQMAQRTLEVHITRLVENAIKKTNIPRICLSGGVASNVKVNMLIRELPEVEDMFVFPHMGDGGLAFGAALTVGNQLFDWDNCKLENVFFGPKHSEVQIKTALQNAKLTYKETQTPWINAANAIAEGKTVLWYQGRMEYGPRALGHRSILAKPDDSTARDRLNLQLKQRVWYQPFCPSILETDASELLQNYKEPNKFMTEAYRTTLKGRKFLAAAINVDGSCRPQIVADDESKYAKLLRALRDKIGIAAVLNTSLNIHGDAMVNTPEEAIDTLKRSGAEILILNNYIVEQ